MHGDLSLLGAEYKPPHAHNVPNVHLPPASVGVLPQVVLAHIDLDTPVPVLQVAEGYLPHPPLGHQPSGQGYGTPFHLRKLFLDLAAMSGYLVPRLDKGVLAQLPQLLELVPADLQNLADVLLRDRLLVVVCHLFSPVSSLSL